MLCGIIVVIVLVLILLISAGSKDKNIVVVDEKINDQTDH